MNTKKLMPGDDFSKYEEMRRQNVSPVDVCKEAAVDGFDVITQIRMIRAVFDLGLGEAKEIMLKADGTDVDEHWNTIHKALEVILENDVEPSSRGNEH